MPQRGGIRRTNQKHHTLGIRGATGFRFNHGLQNRIRASRKWPAQRAKEPLGSSIAQYVVLEEGIRQAKNGKQTARPPRRNSTAAQNSVTRVYLNGPGGTSFNLELLSVKHRSIRRFYGLYQLHVALGRAAAARSSMCLKECRTSLLAALPPA
jgi:hypothetical protein